jgi:hypothetical protein
MAGPAFTVSVAQLVAPEGHEVASVEVLPPLLLLELELEPPPQAAANIKMATAGSALQAITDLANVICGHSCGNQG